MLGAPEVVPVLGFGQPARPAGRLARPAADRRRAVPLVAQVPRVGVNSCPQFRHLRRLRLVIGWDPPPPMMRTSTPDRDVPRRRAEEDEEAFAGSFFEENATEENGSFRPAESLHFQIGAGTRRSNHAGIAVKCRRNHGQVRQEIARFYRNAKAGSTNPESRWGWCADEARRLSLMGHGQIVPMLDRKPRDGHHSCGGAVMVGFAKGRLTT